MGAGLLGLPYVAQKSGILIAVIWLLIGGGIMAYIMLGLGEVILRTKQNHHLAGYAEKYIGKKGKKIMLFAMIFGIYAALLAYIVGESQSLSFILTGSLNQSITAGIIFWAIVSCVTYNGLKAVKKSELIGVTLALVLIATITILAIPDIQKENLISFDLTNWAAPAGLVIFSLLGYSALPEARQIQGKRAPHLKKVILITYGVVVLAYTVFIIAIVGGLGEKTPEIATLALGKYFAIIGVITMGTAYMALATALIDMFHYDYGWHRKQAWTLVSSIPLALFALVAITKIATFTTILELGGIISGGITMVLILLMMRQAKKKGTRSPEYTIPLFKGFVPTLIVGFTILIILELVNLAQ